MNNIKMKVGEENSVVSKYQNVNLQFFTENRFHGIIILYDTVKPFLYEIAGGDRNDIKEEITCRGGHF